MITFTIKGKKYNMINSYDEMTLKQLVLYKDCKAPIGQDDLLAFANPIKILSNVEDINELYKMPNKEFWDLVDELSFLNTEQFKKDLGREIMIAGNKYIISENITDFNSLTFGEYASICTIKEQCLLNSDNPFKYIPDMLAILVRPGVAVHNKELGTINYTMEEFDANDLQARAQLFNDHMSATIALYISHFFFLGKTI